MRQLIWMVLLSASVSACLPTKRDNMMAVCPAGFEHVIVGGELSERINRNYGRMETPLYQPASLFWTEEESGGWPADKEGRTILALVMDARASGRQPKYLDEILTLLPENLNERGYMGTIHDDVDEQQLSGHGWLLRGLCEYHEWTGDTIVLDMACKIAENLFLPIGPRMASYPIDAERRRNGVGDMSGSTQNTVDGWRLSSDIGCVFIGMDGLIHYYKYNRDPRIRSLIELMIDRFFRIDLVGIKAQTHATLTALRGILRYMDITGDRSLLPEVEKRWKLYKEHGMTENNENFNWFDRRDTWTEPCAVVDSYMVAVRLWQLTRREEYIADAERIYYNGLCVAQRANGGFGCDKPLGDVYSDISINADEAHWCCTMRGGEGLARVAESSYFVSDDTIFIPFYQESVLSLPDKGLTLVQHSDYPFGKEVAFDIVSTSGEKIVLAFGIRDYMTGCEVLLNGDNVNQAKSKGFVIVDEALKDGDKISVSYGFKPEVMPVSCDSLLCKVVYGPLVLAAKGSQRCRVKEDAQFERLEESKTFVNKETCDTFTPLYHMMSPSVSIDSAYCRSVLFKRK